jgi:Fe-S cluster assembly ATPase SufC
MEITSVEVERFKRVQKAEIQLSDINVLVGSNNAGKSSMLQGIHFCAGAAVAARRLNRVTFTQQSLLYCPARNFVDLRNGGAYQNQSAFGYLRVRGVVEEDNDQYTVRVYRARNEGNVGCERHGNQSIGTMVTAFIPPFSVYVPGLAGIPEVEEYRSESVVRKGVASGDANLYLRNVLFLIKRKNLLSELTQLMKLIFPNFSIEIKFDQVHDSYIQVLVRAGVSQTKKPIELIGTGVLQALQIFSYTTLFKPKLLLLDEPDSHLHPDNQGLLAQSFVALVENLETKIIISTHSRHLVESLYGESNFVWMKGGKIQEQGDSLEKVPILMDVGALDSFDKLINGAIEYVILTEDANLQMMRTLAEGSGFDMTKTLIYSYKASSNLGSAYALSEFILESAPECTVIIHADNDFLTDDEEQSLREKIEKSGAKAFITEGSDIESYFVIPEHIGELLGEDPATISNWLDELALAKHNKLTHKFSRKRDEAKKKLYKNGNAPDTLTLMGEDVPLPPDKRLGKFMLAEVRSSMHEKFGQTVSLIAESDYLYSVYLENVVE